MKLFAYRPSTVLRISVGVAALVVMVLMALDFSYSLVPNPIKQALERRQIESELLAGRIAQVATQAGVSAVNAAFHEARVKNKALLSAGLRRQDGVLLASTANHLARWEAGVDGRGTLSADGAVAHQMLIPIRAQGQPWGQVELVYTPILSGGRYAELLQMHTLWPMATFLVLTVLLRLYLGRVLHQLDPTSVVPERVRTAYNALGESVVMVDAQGRIVLTNKAFQDLVAPRPILLGRRLEDHPWFKTDTDFHGRHALPWRQAMREGLPMTDARMTLLRHDPDSVQGTGAARGHPETSRVAAVNCTPILDDRERIQGALIVFQDQTRIERTNEQLQRTVTELQLAHAQISEQHDEMMRLATIDPMTSCLNRRAFFESARNHMQRCLFDGRPIAALMVDIDHFKNFNDKYGHSIGDDVIKTVAFLLQKNARPEDLICRYGGEEFCILMPDANEAAAVRLAEQIRKAIQVEAGDQIRDLHLSITASLGAAVCHANGESLEALIDRADQALYTSKRSGRNRVTLAPAEIAPTVQPPAEMTAVPSAPRAKSAAPA